MATRPARRVARRGVLAPQPSRPSRPGARAAPELPRSQRGRHRGAARRVAASTSLSPRARVWSRRLADRPACRSLARPSRLQADQRTCDWQEPSRAGPYQPRARPQGRARAVVDRGSGAPSRALARASWPPSSASRPSRSRVAGAREVGPRLASAGARRREQLLVARAGQRGAVSRSSSGAALGCATPRGPPLVQCCHCCTRSSPCRLPSVRVRAPASSAFARAGSCLCSRVGQKSVAAQ